MSAVSRRIGGLLLTLLLASALIFFVLRLGGGDPATVLAGDSESLTPARLAQVRAQYGLDDPLPRQYASWLSGLLTGDLGQSYVYRLPVASLVGSRLVTTISLALYATVLYVVLGVATGWWSARRRGRLADTVLTSVSTVLSSIPPFVVGLVLLTVLAVGAGWFPVGGGGLGAGQRIQHLTLPALALAAGSIATISRVTRQTMVEQQLSEHVDSAVANGLSERAIVRRHVLRNSALPILTMSGLVFATLFAGTVVIERVFSLSGIGSLLVDSINTNDYPVVQAILLLMVLVYVGVTISIELVAPLIDPRRRTSSTDEPGPRTVTSDAEVPS